MSETRAERETRVEREERLERERKERQASRDAQKGQEAENRREARKSQADISSAFAVVVGNQVKGTYDTEANAQAQAAVVRTDLTRQGVDIRDPEHCVQVGPMQDGLPVVERVYDPQRGTVTVDGQVVRERDRLGVWVDAK